MTNEKLASSANISEEFPGTRPGPITALLGVIVVGGGLIIYYWSAIKTTLGFS